MGNGGFAAALAVRLSLTFKRPKKIAAKLSFAACV
jgi:hypothetical protein